MNYKHLTEQLIYFIEEAQNEKLYHKEIYSDLKYEPGKNEFLFFIKPEITVQSERININKILDLVLTAFKDNNLFIHEIKVLSSKYLSDYNLIAEHYGVINKLSSSARKYLSKPALEKFSKLFNIDSEKADIIGSLEFLGMSPEISPLALDVMSQNIKSEKIAPGTYVQKLNIDGQETFIINGFHPRQLEHFTKSGRSIITFTLSGDIEWKEARNKFIGKTNPNDAEKGSLRNNFLIYKDTFGLETVSSSRNGVHLSAGPIEALVELIRYNSDFSSNNIKSVSDFNFGIKLKENFNDKEIESFLNNDIVIKDGKEISVFDLTEELNSAEALKVLKGVTKN